MSKMSDIDIWFNTLGMVVLDELQFPSKESVTGVVGGSGTYGKFEPARLAEEALG